jgi:LDH2 family malate/lactate/ureidoglycolate dehydrogenase
VEYVRKFDAGELNRTPEVKILSEAPTTLMIDGDGGLGYYPSYLLATGLIPKAKEMGIAVGTTRNHGHFGAAGIYARIPVPHDLFCYVTSGHQLSLTPGRSVLEAAGGSPMAFGLPTSEGAPFVLDFGAMHDLYTGSPHQEEIIALAPGTVFRSFGLGCVCQALGGFLCGVPADESRAQRVWPMANQGSFMIVVDLNRFCPIDQFKAEMDTYARKVAEMVPVKGFRRSVLAGAPEWENEQIRSTEGIPISSQHAEMLQGLATRRGLESPV